MDRPRSREFSVKHDLRQFAPGNLLTLLERRRAAPASSDDPILDNTVAVLSENGIVLSEFSVLDALQSSGVETLAGRASGVRSADVLHCNSVEPLCRGDLRAFEGIAEADSEMREVSDADAVLIPCRHQDLVAVTSLKTGRLLWY